MEEIRRLPDLELEVMQAIWACSVPVDRKDVEDIMAKTHQIAPTTLFTIFTRLAQKGFIQIEKSGRSARYIPMVSQKEYLASQSNRFITKVCGGNIAALASALCDSGLSKEDLEELKSLLENNTL
ncbi:MAG: BlaI/MecI/CopY family transcriptional regulator [Erysipelotrichales bacterium]|nr:BlaI/MecI/CopY family transcriptional regulator [Erysipelotrichales bacterium]